MTMVADRAETSSAGAPFDAARRAMIDSQLRVSGVNDEAILSAFAAIAREAHVPEAARGFAYCDRAIPIADGRHLAAPLFHGRLLDEAKPTPEDRVLVVDGGSGYLPALVRKLAGGVEVTTPATAIAGTGAGGNVTLLLIDGAIERLPASLADTLAEGGRILTGLVSRGVTRLAVGRKIAGDVTLLPVAEMGIPILPEFAAAKEWSF